MQKWLILAFMGVFCSCIQTATSKKETLPITQGIRGKVEIREGNFMPGPDRTNPKAIRAPQGQPAIRELFIYERTKQSQVKANGVFYADIQTKLITTVKSKADGTFQVSLKPGIYSLFSKEPGGLFANQMDGEGYIFPVEVKAGEVTEVEFIIDYNASY